MCFLKNKFAQRKAKKGLCMSRIDFKKKLLLDWLNIKLAGNCKN